jgi:GNAT superfamily N-acetyltransferase
MDLALRPLTRDDLPAWVELLAAIERVDHTGEHYGTADLAEELDNPEAEVGKDFVGAFDGDELVGFWTLLARGAAEGAFKVHVNGSVRPDRRGEGIGTVLAASMLERARAAAAERRPDLPTRVTTTGLSADAGQEALLTAHGLHGERWSFLDAHNLAFDGSHPGFTPWTQTMWKQRVTGSHTFRPTVTFVVLPEGDDESSPT